MRLHICNLTVAGWENILGLATGMERNFKELDGKMAIGGCLHPPLLVF